MFPSSRTVPRLSDFADKTNDVSLAEDEDSARQSRLFGDKQSNRKSVNASETDPRHSKESWMQARERRALGVEDEGERKFGRRDREQDGERRNGFGDKTDSRWGAHKDDKRQNGEKTGGWRERERQKHDRDWDRDRDRPSKDPEWMDDPAPRQDDDLNTMGMPKNQEDFEKWKQAQHARTKKSTNDAVPEPPEPPQSAPLPVAALAQKTETLKLDSLADKAFGGWGEPRQTEQATESAPPSAPTQPPAKGKSRFMPMFQKDKPKEEVPVVEMVQRTANGSDDANKAGFDRILQMLSTTGVPQAGSPRDSVPLSLSQPFTSMEPTSPQSHSRLPSNGQRSKSRFTGFFDQTPKSPEQVQSPQMSHPQAAFKQMENDLYGGGRDPAQELGNSFVNRPSDNYTHERPVTNPPQARSISSAPVPTNGGRDPSPQQNRMHDLFLDPPTRNASTPDNNIQNLLAQRNRGQQGQDKNSDFLLSLLQAKGTSRPASSQAHPDFPLWIDQSKNRVPEPHIPKPVVQAKAGMFEDQLLRHGPPDLLRQEQRQMPGHDHHQRRGSQRAPPGFFDEQSLFLQQQQQQEQVQRRIFTEPSQQNMALPNRRMGGHPGQQMQMLPPGPQYPPQDHVQPALGGHQGPPPGFNPHMRHPPGFHNIPSIFEAAQPQQQQPHQQQQQRQPPLPPAGFGVPGMMPGIPPPNVPPGFFSGPPGFMQMRQPADGLPAAVRGNGRGGYDGFDMGGQRR